MYRKRKKTTGQSLVEYLALVALLLGVFLAFQKYIARGFSGRLKASADALGHERVYSPGKTIECGYLDDGGSPDWYNLDCFERYCLRQCLSDWSNDAACRACLALGSHACFAPICQD